MSALKVCSYSVGNREIMTLFRYCLHFPVAVRLGVGGEEISGRHDGTSWGDSGQLEGTEEGSGRVEGEKRREGF